MTDTKTQTEPTPSSVQDQPQEHHAPVPSEKTPEEFYAEVVERPDIRAILEELAKR